jgi:hypothetical protein
VAIAVVNAFAEHYYWYWLMRWFDMPMHFAGGIWLAGTVLWWRFFSGKFTVSPNAKTIFAWAVLGAIGVGLIWEVYEAAVSYFTVGHMNDILDTIGDLVLDTMGGAVAAGILWVRTHNKQ